MFNIPSETQGGNSKRVAAHYFSFTGCWRQFCAVMELLCQVV